MPYIHYYPLQIRHYECDANEQVNPANYLRYMQEAAFAGSAAIGYTPRRYQEIGYWWLAYETDLSFYKRLAYGDEVTIKTWVVDFRRVRSLRRYEFYRDEELVAEASTDWVLLDVNTMRPASIPEEMIAAYAQGDDVSPAPPRTNHLPQSKPPESAFVMQRRSQWSELDPARHVNNAMYLNYVVDAQVAALGSVGWTPDMLMNDGIILRTRRYQLEYKQAADLNDEIEVTTWFSELGETGGYQHFLIRKAGILLTRVRREWRSEDLATGQLRMVPTPLLDRLRELSVS